ncbi:MAG: aspartate aminotransferase family protein [Dissulfurispiraceae bacterium]
MKRDLIGKAKDVLTPALVIHTDIIAKKARGIYVTDIENRRYMDFTSGLATVNTGHNHPHITKAIKEQARDLIHAGGIFYHKPLINLSHKLKNVTPSGLDTFFFSNSGAEAVEGALKLAKSYTKRQGVIAFTGAFHGRTLGAASLTTSSIRYRRDYHPFLPSVYHSPYPYCYRCFFGRKSAGCGMECYEHLERLMKHLIPPEEVACIIMEPVLGEGGYVVPPADFLKKVRALCDRFGILLILDEVQSGMGRTGKWFASEHFGIIPDIMTIAKGIASGMPLSALVSTKKIMGRWPRGAHGTTFGGNPVSCAAAIATVDVIEKADLLKNATAVGAYALDRLQAMKHRYRRIGNVRGLGLMIGIEFVKKEKTPDPEGVQNIEKYCLNKGLILVECGTDKNIIRLAPPLIIQENEMENGLSILEEAVTKA